MFEWFVVGMLILIFITVGSVHSRINAQEEAFREFIKSLDHVAEEMAKEEGDSDGRLRGL